MKKNFQTLSELTGPLLKLVPKDWGSLLRFGLFLGFLLAGAYFLGII